MCECRSRVNSELAGHNAQLAYGFGFTKSGFGLVPPMIALEKTDPKKRGKLPTLLATHCPFCGERYEAA
jgi:hypothetical protein